MNLTLIFGKRLRIAAGALFYIRQVSKALPLALTRCRDPLQCITHHEPISTMSFRTTKLEIRKGYTTIHTTVGGEEGTVHLPLRIACVTSKNYSNFFTETYVL